MYCFHFYKFKHFQVLVKHFRFMKNYNKMFQQFLFFKNIFYCFYCLFSPLLPLLWGSLYSAIWSHSFSLCTLPRFISPTFPYTSNFVTCFLLLKIHQALFFFLPLCHCMCGFSQPTRAHIFRKNSIFFLQQLLTTNSFLGVGLHTPILSPLVYSLILFFLTFYRVISHKFQLLYVSYSCFRKF